MTVSRTSLRAMGSTVLALALLAGCVTDAPSLSSIAVAPAVDVTARCTPAALQAVAASLATRVTIKEIPNGPKLANGTRLVPATATLPAYCQVTGSYVTNPATGKTANFIATLPANWNGKYLQLGCSGSCGVLLMNNPAGAPITVTAQGYPGQLIEKGYAAFGNNLGHLATGSALNMGWAVKAPGQIDEEALTDFMYRADQAMVTMGKAFTKAFYAPAAGRPATIARSYFNGCSQGGREALVAAARFPQEFDGIIAGSPAADFANIGFQIGGAAVATLRAPDAAVSAPLMTLVGKTVTARCDALDGTIDGLIQNPAACDFRPERDLPRCAPGETGQCFTKAQTDSVNALLSAARDERGTLVQPGYSVSEPTADFSPAKRPADLAAAVPWGGEDVASGFWALSSGLIATLAHRNDPAFRLRAIFSYGETPALHTIVPSSDVARARSVLGIGSPTARDMAALLRSRTKLLIYHNLSDQVLSPYMSINFYKDLARQNGGYARVQRTARLFTLPGTAHCGMAGVGPANFDAIGAMEKWVERGTAPDALLARQNDPKISNVVMGTIDWARPALRTMPLCKFPEMARYSGKGDLKLAANWSCQAGDTGMLRIGESGRRAGVLE